MEVGFLESDHFIPRCRAMNKDDITLQRREKPYEDVT
jgi:hypothetical protein